MNTRFLYYFSLFTIFWGFIFTFVALYWLFFPFKVIEFADKEFPVISHNIVPGGTVTYTVNYCKYMDVTSKVTRSFINEIIFVTPTTINNRPMGCHSINIQVVVPKELPIGQYKMQQVYQYDLNPLRTITIIKDTEVFHVVSELPKQ